MSLQFQMICPVIDCDRYSEMKLTENMIRWAECKHGSTEYAGDRI